MFKQQQKIFIIFLAFFWLRIIHFISFINLFCRVYLYIYNKNHFKNISLQQILHILHTINTILISIFLVQRFMREFREKRQLRIMKRQLGIMKRQLRIVKRQLKRKCVLQCDGWNSEKRIITLNRQTPHVFSYFCRVSYTIFIVLRWSSLPNSCSAVSAPCTTRSLHSRSTCISVWVSPHMHSGLTSPLVHLAFSQGKSVPPNLNRVHAILQCSGKCFRVVYTSWCERLGFHCL